MPEYELRVDGRRVGDRFTSDVDPRDEPLVIALLRATARRHRVNPARAELRTWVGKHRRSRSFRAP
jgi:hypothetical protein